MNLKRTASIATAAALTLGLAACTKPADRVSKNLSTAAYQASLIPGDIGYLCDGCGRDLTGGFLGLGHCKCD